MADFIGGGGLGRVGGGRFRRDAPSDPLAWVPAAFKSVSPAALFSAASGCYAVPQLGPELISNGDFSGGDTGWTYTDWTFDALKAAHLAGTSFDLKQTYNFTPDKIVKFAFEVLDRTQGSITPRIHGGTNLIGKQAYTQNGAHAEYFQIVTGNVDSRLRPTSAFDGSIDNVSIRELDMPALQAGSISDFKADALLPAGLVKNSAGELIWSALGELPYSYSNGSRQLLLQQAWTNKLNCYKSNPVDTSNWSLQLLGDATGTLEVATVSASVLADAVDRDGAPIDLTQVCTSLTVFKLTKTNGLGTLRLYSNLTTGNVNSHGLGAYVWTDDTGLAPDVAIGLSGGRSTHTLTTKPRWIEDIRIPSGTTNRADIRCSTMQSGGTLYFILPTWVEAETMPVNPIIAEIDSPSAVTRDADSFAFDELLSRLTKNETGALVISGTRHVGGIAQTLFEIGDGFNSDRLTLSFTAADKACLQVKFGGATTAQLTSTAAISARENFAIAIRWGTDDFAMSLNGEAVKTGTGSMAVVANLVHAYLNRGRDALTEQQPTHYDYFAIYDTLNDIELQSKTAELVA